MASPVKMNIEVGVDVLTGEVGTLEVGPDDVIVVSVDQRLSGNAVKNIEGVMKGIFGDRKVIVLEEGMKLGVIKYVKEKTKGLQ